MVCVIFAACGVDRLSGTSTGFTVEPTAVTLDHVWRGVPRQFTVTLTNTSRFTEDFDIAPDGSVTVETRALSVLAGESVSVPLTLTRAEVGPYETGVTFTLRDGASMHLSVIAQVDVAPTCDPAADCSEVTFDPISGTCVTHPQPDGLECGSANHCITAGHCQQGMCVGLAVTCDDHNACTRDSCRPEIGCVATDSLSECPTPSDLCHAVRCDPVQGCGVTEVADGTRCGPQDCSTSQVCLAGSCVVKPTPDGATCGHESPCQSEGICRDHQCTQGALRGLTESWTVKRSDPQYSKQGTWSTLQFSGVVDETGNTYTVIDSRIASFAVDGTMRWWSPAQPIFPGTPQLMADETNQVLFVQAGDAVTAVRMSDGSSAWSRDITANIPVRQMGRHGERQLIAHQMTLVGSMVVIDVIEGFTDHFSHLVGFDRLTGFPMSRIEFHGHSNAIASTSTGVLTVSKSDCAMSTIFTHYVRQTGEVRMYQGGNLRSTSMLLGTLQTFAPEFSGATNGSDFNFSAPGGTTSHLQFATPFFGSDTESWSSPSRTLIFGSVDTCPSCDALWSTFAITSVSGLMTQHPVIGSTMYMQTPVPEGALLADDNVLLMETASDYGGVLALPGQSGVVSTSVLSRYAPDGTRLWACPLPMRGLHLGIAKDQVIIGSDNELHSFSLPDVRPTSNGWTSTNGNQARTRQVKSNGCPFCGV